MLVELAVKAPADAAADKIVGIFEDVFFVCDDFEIPNTLDSANGFFNSLLTWVLPALLPLFSFETPTDRLLSLSCSLSSFVVPRATGSTTFFFRGLNVDLLPFILVLMPNVGILGGLPSTLL